MPLGDPLASGWHSQSGDRTKHSQQDAQRKRITQPASFRQVPGKDLCSTSSRCAAADTDEESGLSGKLNPWLSSDGADTVLDRHQLAGTGKHAGASMAGKCCVKVAAPQCLLPACPEAAKCNAASATSEHAQAKCVLAPHVFLNMQVHDGCGCLVKSVRECGSEGSTHKDTHTKIHCP